METTGHFITLDGDYILETSNFKPDNLQIFNLSVMNALIFFNFLEVNITRHNFPKGKLQKKY